MFRSVVFAFLLLCVGCVVLAMGHKQGLCSALVGKKNAAVCLSDVTMVCPQELGADDLRAVISGTQEEEQLEDREEDSDGELVYDTHKLDPASTEKLWNEMLSLMSNFAAPSDQAAQDK